MPVPSRYTMEVAVISYVSRTIFSYTLFLIDLYPANNVKKIPYLLEYSDCLIKVVVFHSASGVH